MNITIDATYENGVLKPSQPLPLKEHEKVRIAVLTGASSAQRTYGIVGWPGDAADFDRIMRESEVDFLEEQ